MMRGMISLLVALCIVPALSANGADRVGGEEATVGYRGSVDTVAQRGEALLTWFVTLPHLGRVFWRLALPLFALLLNTVLYRRASATATP
jgi:hypothetical protein